MIRVTVPYRFVSKCRAESSRRFASSLLPFPSFSLGEFPLPTVLSFGEKEREEKKLILPDGIFLRSSGGNPRGSSTRDQGVAGGELPVATAKGDSSARRVPEPVDHLRPALRHLAQVLGRHRVLQIGSPHLRAQALASSRAFLLREYLTTVARRSNSYYDFAACYERG